MILGEPLGSQLVREWQPDADRHRRRPIVSALPTLDDPRSIRAVDDSGVMGAPHADLLLLAQRPLDQRHPPYRPIESTQSTGGSRLSAGRPHLQPEALTSVHHPTATRPSLIVECQEIGAGGNL